MTCGAVSMWQTPLMVAVRAQQEQAALLLAAQGAKLDVGALCCFASLLTSL